MPDIKKVLFIHHSTGANLIKQGNVRKLLKDLNPNIEFWDHSYNLYKTLPLLLAKFTYHTGLSDQKSNITGKDFNIVLSNNSPREYAEIFSRDRRDKTLNAILQYDVIVFKNCYPTSKIVSSKQLNLYKSYYEQICDGLARFHGKKFALVTFPPYRKELTKEKYAQNAKMLVKWLNSKDFIRKSKNLRVFDFFSLLADNNGFLKKEYCPMITLDSHPNKQANREIGPKFVRFISNVVV